MTVCKNLKKNAHFAQILELNWLGCETSGKTYNIRNKCPLVDYWHN